MSVPIVVATGCKSLWDAAQKVNPVLGERRTLIDLLSIKERLEEHPESALRWIPTWRQLADMPTKRCPKLRALLAMAYSIYI